MITSKLLNEWPKKTSKEENRNSFVRELDELSELRRKK
jgi:hypothetical protein